MTGARLAWWAEYGVLVWLADLNTPWEWALGALAIHVLAALTPWQQPQRQRRVIQSMQTPGERSGPAPKDTDHESPVHS